MTDYTEMTLAQLADTYNALVEENEIFCQRTGFQKVKRFASKGKAIARLNELQKTIEGFEAVDAAETEVAEEEEEFGLTDNEMAAAMVFVKLCLDSMGGSRPIDLDDDPLVWIDTEDLVKNGWSKEAAAGTVGALMEKGMVMEYDEDELGLTESAYRWLDTQWDAYQAKPAKPTKPAKPEGNKKRGPAPTFADDQVIRLLVEENPKREGSKAFYRFRLYHDKMTVGEFLAAGGRRADLAWDTERGFIVVK